MDLPAGLPVTFSYSEARKAGVTKWALYRLRDDGKLIQLSNGLYRRADVEQAVDFDLITIAQRASRATLCLTTALAKHDLTDAIPASTDIALPKDVWTPKLKIPITWHRFDLKTFDLGREMLTLDEETRIGIYNPERCIIDAFRMSGREGKELGREALRRWLRRRGSQPASLLRLAKFFPRCESALIQAIEILL